MPSTDRSGAVLPAADDAVGPSSVSRLRLIRSSGSINMFHSNWVESNALSQIAICTTDSTAQHTSHLILSQCGAARARPYLFAISTRRAQSPSSRQQTLCQWLEALRGGTTSRLPELDALSNCWLCTITPIFLLSASVSGLVPAVWQSMLSWYRSWTRLPSRPLCRSRN